MAPPPVASSTCAKCKNNEFGAARIVYGIEHTMYGLGYIYIYI